MLYPTHKTLLSALLLVSAANSIVIPGQNSPQLEERTGSSGCNADNLLRLIRGQDNLPQGLAFCSTWLGKVHTTITLASTVTPTITTTSTSTSTSTSLLTEITTATETHYTTITSTQTTTVPDNPSTITTTTYIIDKKRRLARATAKPLSDQILSNTYPASRISSACNCLTLEPATTATVYSTETAVAVTSVVIVPAVAVTSVTITDTVQVTRSVTAVEVETATVTVWTVVECEVKRAKRAKRVVGC
ncbi:hypothetical protein TWF481_001697 [Arthrobotrys musiformis]|uniref:Uncharacterized protein n=1 Tax=Arthrobotrys musiformis TaxID=47236 RepID=A0AAV9VW24_9PEZI